MKAPIGIAGLLAASAIVSISSSASAAGHANGFGEKGQLIITADRLVPVFNYSYASVTTSPNGIDITDSSSGSGISLLFGRTLSDNARVPVNVHAIPRVAFDITVTRSLTIGAGIAFGFGLGGTNKTEALTGNVKRSAESDAPTSTAIGLAPRIGYILALSDLFAFWPRAGFGFYSVSGTQELTNGAGVTTTIKATDTTFSLDLDPQFALVPLEHFFFHAGPVVNIPLSGTRSASTTTGGTTTEASIDSSLFNIGLSAGLGGWFNVF